MEQPRYWMWTKRRHGGLSSHHHPHLHQASATAAPAAAAAAYDDSSWEEQAFAEDAAGSLGGCVWPPRSYSCSFCGREFRSAQALGGHMNVHRRDRARLKQSPTPPGHDNNNHHQNSDQNPFLPYQSDDHELCNNLNFVYNPNPNSPHASTDPIPSSPSSSKENCHEKALFPTFSSPFADDLHVPKAKKSTKSPANSSSSSPKSWSNLVAADTARILESGCRVKADLSVSLNLVVRRTVPTTSGSNVCKEESSSVVGCKRKRTDDHTPTLPFFLKPVPIIERHRFLQPAELSPSSSVDDIDLELRLGDPPKVK